MTVSTGTKSITAPTTRRDTSYACCTLEGQVPAKRHPSVVRRTIKAASIIGAFALAIYGACIDVPTAEVGSAAIQPTSIVGGATAPAGVNSTTVRVRRSATSGDGASSIEIEIAGSPTTAVDVLTAADHSTKVSVRPVTQLSVDAGHEHMSGSVRPADADVEPTSTSGLRCSDMSRMMGSGMRHADWKKLCGMPSTPVHHRY